MTLSSKVIKCDLKKIISLCQSKFVKHSVQATTTKKVIFVTQNERRLFSYLMISALFWFSPSLSYLHTHTHSHTLSRSRTHSLSHTPLLQGRKWVQSIHLDRFWYCECAICFQAYPSSHIPSQISSIHFFSPLHKKISYLFSLFLSLSHSLSHTHTNTCTLTHTRTHTS